MARDLFDASRSLSNLADYIDRGKRETVFQAALQVKDEFMAGPPSVGVSRHGRLKWGAGFDIKGGARPTALVQYRGPVHWIERGTQPHIITPKGATGSRASRAARVSGGESLRFGRKRGARGLRFPDGNVRTFVRHPGARAKPFFRGVVRKSRTKAGETVRSDLHRNIRRAGFRSFT